MFVVIMLTAGPPVAAGLIAYFHAKQANEQEQRKLFIIIAYSVFLLIAAVGGYFLWYADNRARGGLLPGFGEALIGTWLLILAFGSAITTAIGYPAGCAVRRNYQPVPEGQLKSEQGTPPQER